MSEQNFKKKESEIRDLYLIKIMAWSELGTVNLRSLAGGH